MKTLITVKMSHKTNSDKVNTGPLENDKTNNTTLNGNGDTIASTIKSWINF